MARVLVAIPAAFVAILFVDLGGLPFALFMIVAGVACLHELFGLLERWRPVTVVGFASLTGMVLAARFGGLHTVMGVAIGTLPVVFLAVVARGGGGRPTVAIAGTMLGVVWIGLAFAHAVLLRQLHHGGAIVIDVLVGTFLGDTGAYVGGRLFGPHGGALDRLDAVIFTITASYYVWSAVLH